MKLSSDHKQRFLLLHLSGTCHLPAL